MPGMPSGENHSSDSQTCGPEADVLALQFLVQAQHGRRRAPSARATAAGRRSAGRAALRRRAGSRPARGAAGRFTLVTCVLPARCRVQRSRHGFERRPLRQPCQQAAPAAHRCRAAIPYSSAHQRRDLVGVVARAAAGLGDGVLETLGAGEHAAHPRQHVQHVARAAGTRHAHVGAGGRDVPRRRAQRLRAPAVRGRLRHALQPGRRRPALQGAEQHRGQQRGTQSSTVGDWCVVREHSAASAIGGRRVAAQRAATAASTRGRLVAATSFGSCEPAIGRPRQRYVASALATSAVACGSPGSPLAAQ